MSSSRIRDVTAVDPDVIYRGKLENSGRKMKSDDRQFWCVWRNEYVVGKVLAPGKGEKVCFRIIDLTTLNFRVSKIPIDRKLRQENGTYLQLFHLYRDCILNLAIVDSGMGESLVFLEYDLNTFLTTYHPALSMDTRGFVREMTPQNTVLWRDYFYFVRSVVLESDCRKIHAEVYRYNLLKKGKLRCISRLPENRARGAFVNVTFDAIESDRAGIVLFGVKTPLAPPYSEKVALLDVRRNSWTLFPFRIRRKTYTPCASLEKTFLAESGGDLLFIKRTQELELWLHHIYTRKSTLMTKITGLYVELVHRLSSNNILIITRCNDEFYLIRKGQRAPPRLTQLAADCMRRHNMHKPTNLQLKRDGMNRKFFNNLFR